MSDYYKGLNSKLLDAIPQSNKILEFGCSSGRLGQRFKELNPSAIWHGVDIHQPSLEIAGKHLDRVWRLDLDKVDVETFEDGYDCVVCGDIIEHLKEPERLIFALARITTGNAQLVCCVPNMSHISILERMLIGDLTYDPMGLMDQTHLRFFSQSSIFKMFLDAGWLPHLQDSYEIGHPSSEFVERLISCAEGLGASRTYALRTLLTYQMIITCVRTPLSSSHSAVPITAIVPVNNEEQFALNAARSPGLKEIGAQILPIRGAKCAAEAFEQGRAQAQGNWLIFCHQDVYFPVGSGFAVCGFLADVPAGQTDRALVGFAGIGTMSSAEPYEKTFNAGLVIDRIHRYDWPAAEMAVSLDELAIVVHRDTKLRIDPSLGWHLWATDLCLAAIRSRPSTFARIARIPVFHNSFSPYELTTAFHTSLAQLSKKYRDIKKFRSLCIEA